MQTLARISFLAALVYGSAVAAFAGNSASTSSVIVTAEDCTGAVIPGAAVKLQSRSGVTYEAKTGPAGSYKFDQLTPDVYSLEVFSQGFAKNVRAPFQLRSGAIHLIAALEVGVMDHCFNVRTHKPSPCPDWTHVDKREIGDSELWIVYSKKQRQGDLTEYSGSNQWLYTQVVLLSFETLYVRAKRIVATTDMKSIEAYEASVWDSDKRSDLGEVKITFQDGSYQVQAQPTSNSTPK